MQRHFVASGEVICLPGSIQLTGTIESSETLVTGTGTDFVSELLINGAGGALKYNYIFSPSDGAIAEIVSVLSPTTLVIKNAFPSDLGGDNFFVVDQSIGYNSVSFNPLGSGVMIANVGEAPSELDENSTDGYEDSNGLKPIGVLAAAGHNMVISMEG